MELFCGNLQLSKRLCSLSCLPKAQGWLRQRSPLPRCLLPKHPVWGFTFCPPAALPLEEDHCLLTSLRRRGGEAWGRAWLPGGADVRMCRKMTEKKQCQGERAGPPAQPQGMARAQQRDNRAEGLGSQAKPAVPAGLDSEGAGFTDLPLVARELPGLSRTSASLGYYQALLPLLILIHSTPALRTASFCPRLAPVQTPLTAYQPAIALILPAFLSFSFLDCLCSFPSPKYNWHFTTFFTMTSLKDHNVSKTISAILGICYAN